MPGERILLVEDDDAIARSLVRALSSQGWSVDHVMTGAGALDRFASVDLVLLDLGLPDLDGLEVCRRIRDVDATVPIVMLTAKSEEIDVVLGLDAGAVDYITKPFGLAELFARLRVQLRRSDTDTDLPLISIGDLVLDSKARRVWLQGDEVQLRVKEFDVLLMLTQNAGMVVTRDSLMTEVWDAHWFGSTKTLDVHIASIRRKMGEMPGDPSRITTIRGVGYRFERP